MIYNPLMRWIAALLLGMTCLGASAGEPTAELQTMWEVLWHQSGIPTKVAKWHDPIAVYIRARDYDTIANTLRDTAATAGVPITFVPTVHGANVLVEAVSDRALSDSQPCVTVLDFRADESILGATITMRRSDVARCIGHESLHLMGLRGHPEHGTALSYFQRSDDITPLDRAMLRGWYAPQMKAGMSPFEAFPIMAQETLCAAPDRKGAFATRDLFYARAMKASYEFAYDKARPPEVVVKSGKFNENSASTGAEVMRGFLRTAPGVPAISSLQCTKSPLTTAAVASN